MPEVNITYECTTAESCEHGDFSDHGWVAPNEYQVSLRRGTARQYAKRVRMSQRGRYDWTLGEAVRFMLDKVSDGGHSEVDTDVETWKPGRSWVVRVTRERLDDGCGEATGYDLFIKGLSRGTAARLERLFASAGCRLPYARSYSFRRVG